MSGLEHQVENVNNELEQVNETTTDSTSTDEEQEGVYLDELEYSDTDDEESEEIETIDVTNEPLYHILSAFLEDEEGANLIDKLSELTTAVKTNTKVMSKLLKGLSSKKE
jgi:hypothetical protein